MWMSDNLCHVQRQENHEPTWHARTPTHITHHQSRLCQWRTLRLCLVGAHKEGHTSITSLRVLSRKRPAIFHQQVPGTEARTWHARC